MNIQYNPTEIEDIFQSRVLNRQQYFEPTVTIFKNALVINYKKIGTRFMATLGALPQPFSTNKTQFDLYFNSYPKGGSKYETEIYQTLNNFGNTEYIYTSFDIWEQDLLSPEPEVLKFTNDRYIGFNNYKTTTELLEYERVKTINELLFKNPHKDIVLILRNPMRRYISGATQLLHHMIDDIPHNENLRNELKFFTNLEYDELRSIYKILRRNPNEANLENISSEDSNAIYHVIKYIIDKRPDLTCQDIHTQNYLTYYIDFINKIEDKSRIKIINIDDCKHTNAAYFFDKLRGDTLISDEFDSLVTQRETNNFLYNVFVKKFVGDVRFWDTSMRFYLEPEYYNYDVLINSPYYIDLKKKEV